MEQRCESSHIWYFVRGLSPPKLGGPGEKSHVFGIWEIFSRNQLIVMARRGVSDGRIRHMLLANSDKPDSNQSAGEEEEVGAVAGADAKIYLFIWIFDLYIDLSLSKQR